MNQLAQALGDFARIFDALSVPYAIMGGLAVRVHGIPRPTHDVDITVAVERERLPEVYDAVRAAGYTVPEAYQSGWVDNLAGMPLVKFRLHLADGRGVDVDIFLAESEFQQQMLSRRQPIETPGLKSWIVSAEDLVLLKLLANRPRDIADIGDVLFTQGQLDESYLRHWARELGVLDRLESVLANPPL